MKKLLLAVLCLALLIPACVLADGTVSICGGRPVPAAYDDTAGDEEAENSGAELLIVRDGACLDVFSGAGCHAHALILPGDAVGAEDRVLTLSASGSLEYCMNELE